MCDGARERIPPPSPSFNLLTHPKNRERKRQSDTIAVHTIVIENGGRIVEYTEGVSVTKEQNIGFKSLRSKAWTIIFQFAQVFISQFVY
jgi:hypothetical protein